MNNREICPECGSALKAWADIDVKINFEINKNGKLVKRDISNNWQTDESRAVQMMAVRNVELVCAEVVRP